MPLPHGFEWIDGCLSKGLRERGVNIYTLWVATDGRDLLRQREMLAGRSGQRAAVVARDLLEHLTKHEVLNRFGQVFMALVPAGVFVAKAPNAVRPLGGHK